MYIYAGVSSIADNGITYFNCISIILEVTFRNKSVRDAIRISHCIVLIPQFHENKMFPIKMDP